MAAVPGIQRVLQNNWQRWQPWANDLIRSGINTWMFHRWEGWVSLVVWGYQETSSVCSSARWHARLWCWRFVPFVAFGDSAQRRVGRATGKTFKPLNLLLIGNSLDSPFRMIDMWTSPSWTNLIHRFWSYSGRNLWNRILWEICDLSFNKSWLAFFLRIFASCDLLDSISLRMKNTAVALALQGEISKVLSMECSEGLGNWKLRGTSDFWISFLQGGGWTGWSRVLHVVVSINGERWALA